MSHIVIKISLGWFVAYIHLGNLWRFSNLKPKIREEIVIFLKIVSILLIM